MPLTMEAKDKAAGGLKSAKTTGGAGALRDALGINELIAPGTTQQKSGAEALREELDRIAKTGFRPSTTTQTTKRRTFSPTQAAPTSTMRKPQSSYQAPEISPSGPSLPVGSMMIPDLASTPGSEREAPADDPEMEERSALDVWEQMSAERQNRPVRTANVFGDEYDDRSQDGNWFDNQLQYVGNTQTNDAYIRDAMDHGLSEDDARDIMGGDMPWWDSLLNKGSMFALDDGTYDYNHMTADKMTGTQYMRYAEMGMGGRPVNEIDPTKVYSKRRELNDYGFIPFTPDEATALRMATNNVLDLPGRLGSIVGNARTGNPLSRDYSITYGDGNTISGRDFDKLSEPYLNQFNYYDRFDPERYLTRPDDENYTALVREYAVPDVNGDDTYHYGSLTGMEANGDGTYTARFSDGSDVSISQDYFDSISNGDGTVSMRSSARVPVGKARGTVPENLDSLNDMELIRSAANDTGASPLDYADVLYIPDLVMSDGTRISLDDVQRLYYDREPEDNPKNDSDDDISYGFSSGPLPLISTNKPRRLMQQEFFSDGKMDFSDAGDNVLDWTLGSLPISVGRLTPWLYSASNGLVSMSGADPGTYDPSVDSYGLIAGDYDDEGNLRYGVSDENGDVDDARSDRVKFWNIAGNALVPFTEQIVGPVGEHVIPIERWSDSIFGAIPRDSAGNPLNPSLGQLLRNEVVGAFGEGVEEDFGNIFDEITQYGPEGMFTNQMTDADGNPMYDLAGHEIRDYGTSAEDRLRNLLDLEDLGNSFAGGVGVDALMRLVPFLSEVPAAARTQQARRKTGVRQYRAPEPQEKRRRLSKEYLDSFDDRIEDDEDEQEEER